MHWIQCELVPWWNGRSIGSSITNNKGVAHYRRHWSTHLDDLSNKDTMTFNQIMNNFDLGQHISAPSHRSAGHTLDIAICPPFSPNIIQVNYPGICNDEYHLSVAQKAHFALQITKPRREKTDISFGPMKHIDEGALIQTWFVRECEGDSKVISRITNELIGSSVDLVLPDTWSDHEDLAEEFNSFFLRKLSRLGQTFRCLATCHKTTAYWEKTAFSTVSSALLSPKPLVLKFTKKNP